MADQDNRFKIEIRVNGNNKMFLLDQRYSYSILPIDIMMDRAINACKKHGIETVIIDGGFMPDSDYVMNYVANHFINEWSFIKFLVLENVKEFPLGQSFFFKLANWKSIIFINISDMNIKDNVARMLPPLIDKPELMGLVLEDNVFGNDEATEYLVDRIVDTKLVMFRFTGCRFNHPMTEFKFTIHRSKIATTNQKKDDIKCRRKKNPRKQKR